MAVIRPSIDTDPVAIEEIGLDYLRAVIPGWEPAEGDLLTWTIRAHARMVAEERDVADDVPLEQILRPLAEKVYGLTPLEAAPATASATFTMRDDAGYTIPAGLEVLVRTAGDDGVAMLAIAPVTVAPGATRTSAGEVQLRAAPGYEGEIGNGLGPSDEVVSIRSFEFLDAIELVGESSGGRDAETDEEFMARFVGEVALTSPAPILPNDFAVLARRHPSVARALALNLYDPVARTSRTERMVTVVVADADGEPLASGTRAEVQASLEALREVNWRCPVVDPVYTAIDVTFAAVTYRDAVAADVRTAAIAALTDYLSPATWGASDDEAAGWIDEPLVRYLEVADVLQRVPGLRWVTSLGIARQGGTPATADITLAGPGALTRPGTTITGTVTRGT